MIEVLIVLGIAIIGVSYYFIFKEHHKKNEMTFAEIYPLVIEYFTISIISIILLGIGLGCIIRGCAYNEEIKEVIKEFTIGIIIISLTIIHFIFWIKTHKVDLEISEREEKETKTSNIAEWIELIAFILIIVASIFNIVKYIQFVEEAEKYKQIGTSILCIIASVILLYNMNPLEVKDRIKGIFKKGSK